MEKTFAATVAALLITGAAVLGLFAFFEEPEREAEIVCLRFPTAGGNMLSSPLLWK